ncbi:hypothetical protein E2C01_101928 [Portunus trituberculatus]|uniref:Uncharacterized protein n=1 Tax=Portunus trituberculatus TaxID=210409 RepID=A0A5B7KLE0_PORTR|nr:hypothetical protein [Portunus trituberculatus]
MVRGRKVVVVVADGGKRWLVVADKVAGAWKAKMVQEWRETRHLFDLRRRLWPLPYISPLQLPSLIFTRAPPTLT